MARIVALSLVFLTTVACAVDSRGALPLWDHVVVVVLENRSASQVRSLPQLTLLREMGREYTNSFGVSRPSQPNYIALFSGGTQGVSDNLEHALQAPNLSTALALKGYRVVTYAQGLPSVGFRGDQYPYLRKHNPAASFDNVPDDAILPLSALPVGQWDSLPEVSFIIPDMLHGMHDGASSVVAESTADSWLAEQVVPYAAWARDHRSLLVLTFDEPDPSLGSDVSSSPILTLFVGEGIAPSTSDQRLTHYTVLGYLLDAFGAPRLGLSEGEPKL